MKKHIFTVIKAIIIILGLGISFYFVNTLQNLNMIPNKYMSILILGMLILNFIAISTLLIKKIWAKIISVVVYLLILFISILGSIVGGDVNNFLEEGFNNNNAEVTTYHILVLKDSEYEKIWNLDNKKIGYLGTDPQVEECLEILNKKSHATLEEEKDLYNLYLKLMTSELAAIVLDEAYLSILANDYETLEKDIKTIYTFELEKTVEKEYEKLDELKPFSIYISGSDSRSSTIAAKSLSDVNMIMTVNPETRTILLTGIPRDYYVQLHGTTGLKDKLTHSGAYGMDMGRLTLEDLFGIKIDYSVKVGFNSVVELVDLVGGIDIESDQTFHSFHLKGWVVQKGMNHMNGNQALAYSRERYAYVTGDIHRVQNQQQVLEAIIKKISTDKSVLVKYQKIMNALKDFYRTDVPKELVQLLVKAQLEDMSGWTIITQNVSGSGAMNQTYTGPGPKRYVMIPYEKDIKNATEKIQKVLDGKSI